MKNFNAKISLLCLFVLFSLQSIWGQGNCTLDPTWDNNGMLSDDQSRQADAMCILPDGRLLAVCNTNSSGQTRIKCFNPDGSLDLSYGTNGLFTLGIGNAITEAYSICYNNGIVYLAGMADSAGLGYTYGYVAATTIDGHYSTQFGTNGVVKFNYAGHRFNHVKDLLADDNGDLYIAGVQWYDTFFVAKLNPSGQLISSFGNNGCTKIGDPDSDRYWFVRDIALDRNNQLLVTGKFMGNVNNGLPFFQHMFVTRFKSSGELDNTFANNGIGYYNSSAGIDNEGKSMMVTVNNDYVVGGIFLLDDTVGGTLTKIKNDGSLDPNFGNNGWLVDTLGQSYWWENELVAQVLPDGHILAAATRYVGYTFYFGLRLYNMDGSLDHTFGNNGTVMTLINTDNRCYLHSIELDLQRNKIYAGGYSTYCAQTCGPPFIAIARYDYTFGAPMVANDKSLASSFSLFPNPVESAGKVFINGIDENELQAIELFDLTGAQKMLIHQGLKIELPELAPGVYFMRVHTIEGIHTRKLVVR